MEKIFYFAQVFEGIKTTAIIIFIVMLITFVISFCAFMIDCDGDFDAEDSTTKCIKKIGKISITSLIISVIIMIFVPNKQTYLFMVGGKVIDNIAKENPEVKEIPGNTLDLLNEYIKTQTQELRNRSSDEE